MPAWFPDRPLEAARDRRFDTIVADGAARGQKPRAMRESKTRRHTRAHAAVPEKARASTVGTEAARPQKMAPGWACL